MSYFKIVCAGCGAEYHQGIVGRQPVGNWNHECPTPEQNRKRKEEMHRFGRGRSVLLDASNHARVALKEGEGNG